MAIVHIRVHGYEYDIACDDGEEDQLRFLADEVDDRVRAIASGKGGNPGEAMSLLIAALVMADELIENKREIKKIAAEANRLAALVQNSKNSAPAQQPDRMAEIESAMAVTLEEIALKIEKIADRIEMV
jgi:cell division protein ZapA